MCQFSYQFLIKNSLKINRSIEINILSIIVIGKNCLTIAILSLFSAHLRKKKQEYLS